MKKIMYFAAALLVLVGCQKSQEAKENAPANYGTITGKIELPQGPNKISAPTDWEEAETAFTMVWDAGDQIYIYNGSECKQLSNPTIVNGIATFEGELLTDMSEYKVAYGYDPKADATAFAVDYIAGNYHPFAAGTGTDYTFTIANFEPIIGLQLKGTDELSKIEVVLSDKDNKTLATYTMTFAEALALNASTATDVYFPIQANAEAAEMAISFYKNESSADVLIMTKTTTNIPEEGNVTTFPELTVAEPFVPTYVDLGLPSGLKWATCNLGATTPEGYGDYFAWGETIPKESYHWNTYNWCNGSSDTQTKYCIHSEYGYNGFTDGKTSLDIEDDAAHVNWGGNWRMPTAEEIEELMNTENCTWKWQENYNSTGVNGHLVTSKKNGNTLFLPAPGRRGESGLSLDSWGGFYWSSSLHENYSHWALNLSIDALEDVEDWKAVYKGHQSRYCGQSIRPVCTVVE